MKKNQGVVVTAELNPYQQLLTVVFTDSPQGAANYYGIDDEGCDELGGFTSSIKDGPLICLRVSGLTYGIVSHESTHATYVVFRNIGEDISKAEEAFAYLQQYIFECCTEAAKRNKIKVTE